MAWLKQLKDQFQNLWKGFDNQTRILLGTVLFAVIIGLIFLATWASRPELVALYTNLSDKDASSIVNWLKQSGIKYDLGSNGSTVLVPQDKKHQILIDLAGEGLTPRGGAIGFEIFDQPKIGATDKERQIQYARAVAGEMARSIELIDGIEFARVSVSIPEKSLFVEEEQPATASVIIKIYPGLRLTQQNVSAITHLVAGGVEGLTADHVTIIDTNGNILNQATEAGVEDFGQVATSQFQAQRQYEQRLKSELHQMLTRMFGPNNFVVTVTAKMNFDKEQVIQKIFQPVIGDEGIIRSQQTAKENYSGTGSTASGVPGTESNIPQYQSNADGTSTSQYTKEQNTLNYELNERQVQQVKAPGTIEQISVAVVVNRELDDTNMNNLRTTISSAIGINPNRGDQVSVVGMPFDNSLEEEYLAAVAARQAAEQRQMIIYAVAGLIGFIFLFILFRISRRNSLDRSTGRRVNVLVDDAEEQVAASLAHEMTPEEKARIEMRKEIADLISNKPEDVAELLKTWLTED